MGEYFKNLNMASENRTTVNQTNEMSEFINVTWIEQPLHFLNRIKAVVGPGGTFKHDVKIACDEGSVKCHKMLLAMSSPYFDKVFKGSKLGKKQKVMLPFVSKRVFGYLYEYICNGRVTLPLDQKTLFIEAGKILQIEGLKGMTNVEQSQDKNFVFERQEKHVMDIGIRTDSVPLIDSDGNGNLQLGADGNLMTTKRQLEQPPQSSDDDSNKDKLMDPDSASHENLLQFNSEPVTKEVERPDKKSKAEELAFICESSDDSDFMDPIIAETKTQTPESKPRSSKIASRLKIRPFFKSNTSKQLASKQISKRKRNSAMSTKAELDSSNRETKKKKEEEEIMADIICEFQDCDFTASTEAEMTSHSEQHNTRYYCSLCQQVFMLQENRDAHSKNCSTSD